MTTLPTLSAKGGSTEELKPGNVAHWDSNVARFLADTWWFGLSRRLPEQDLKDLAVLRAAQGFSAIQLVVGVPPEVGPGNENAQSAVGFPWTLDGRFNQRYLDLARDKIQYLNNLGLVVIVYGAWGHQIEWLGRGRMHEWWLKIIDVLDTLNVVYCLCGESDLWVGEASKLLPDKSTDDLPTSHLALPARLKGFLVEVAKGPRGRFYRHQLSARRRAWSSILEDISKKTTTPIVVHPISTETGYQAVLNPHLLAANTAQTGHDERARNRLWQLPLALLENDTSRRGYINLEPWYEGIRDRFWAEDQLFAYWASMLAGAMSHCYGAHGIWNVGDGRFLAHWGKQTFAQARALDTPRLLARSHEQYLLRSDHKARAFVQVSGRKLVSIGRKTGSKLVQFFPDVSKARHVPEGRIWLPQRGTFAGALPARGPVVVFVD